MDMVGLQHSTIPSCTAVGHDGPTELDDEKQTTNHHHESLPETRLIFMDADQRGLNVTTTSTLMTMPLVLAILVAAASQFLVGYNIGVMNAPGKVVFPGHTTALWSFAVASFAVGGPFGALVGGKMADRQGRRGALLVDTWIFFVGGLLQTLAPDMYMIIVSRFLIGLASGFSSVLVPIYLGELAPPSLRGRLGTVTQFALVIGILIADLLAFPFATVEGWRTLFAVTAVVSAMQLLCSPFLLESPRWLLTQDYHSVLARYNIQRLCGLCNEQDVEIEVENMYGLGGGGRGGAPKQEEQATSSQTDGDVLKEMLTHPPLRSKLVSCLILQMAQQLCGINAVFYYSTSFFEGVIDNPLAGTTLVGAVNVVATYVALLLMDQCGRRSLILWSSGGMFLSCIAIVVALLGYLNNMSALVAVNVYVVFFELGLGPIPWLIASEAFEAHYVAMAMSLCSQLNWICNFIIGLVFPYMKEHLGPYSFVPFAAVLGCTFVFAWTILPVTTPQSFPPDEWTVELTHHSNNSNGSDDQGQDNDADTMNGKWRKANVQDEKDTEKNAGTYGTSSQLGKGRCRSGRTIRFYGACASQLFCIN
jgi:MFS transporter, SP family, solute carrier family 2 (facilitated glucose transporter), member 3